MIRSGALSVTSYRIHLDLSEAAQGSTTFPSHVIIRVNVRQPISTFLDFIGEGVHSVRVDGHVVATHYDGARIHLPELGVGPHEIEVKAVSNFSRTGEGLHRFVDPVDNETYLYTQFEPADSRRVFPNFEQPDLKARFAISMAVPRSWTALSNGKEIRRDDAGTNSTGEALSVVSFAETKVMPTYLTAFIAGPYVGVQDSVTIDAKVIPLGFYCRKTLMDYLDVTEYATITKQGLAIMPELFDFPYPWGKYDSVFVPEYNLGAMENPGCVTFNEDSFISRGAVTRARHAGRANTILHEMSHMWFGDLVTMRWWDDLWLKESFAEFMGAWTSARATKYTEAWQNFAGSRIAWAMAHDQYPTTHPIVADIVDLEAADQNFDGITYAKGAAVLRQLVSFVGEEAFFAGARAYFADHAYGNATLDDLLIALERSSGRDLRSWSAQWLQSAGVSTVRVSRTDDGVHLSQTGIDPLSGKHITRPHVMTVSGFALDNGELIHRASTQTELATDVVLPWDSVGGEDVDLILANSGAETYIKIELDNKSLDNALHGDINDGLPRAVLSAALWQMVRDAKLDPGRYVNFVLDQRNLDDAGILQQRTNGVASIITGLAAPDQRKILAPTVLGVAGDILTELTPGSDRHTIWSTLYATAAGVVETSTEGLRQQLTETTDQDLRWDYLTALSAFGRVSQTELDDELARTGTASDAINHRRARATLPGTRSTTLEEILSGSASNNEVQALLDGFTHPSGTAEARSVLPDYFNRLESWWESFSQEIAERLVYDLYPLSDASPSGSNPDYDEATRWLDEHTSAPAALRKIILDLRHEHSRKLSIQSEFPILEGDV